MITARRLGARSGMRRRGGELLEGRALLAAEVAAFVDSASSGSDPESVPTDLPTEVARTIETHFVGATIESVTLDHDEPAAIDVAVQWSGVRWELKLTRDGEFLETAQPLDVAELPQAMQDWLAREYPGVAIQKVELITAGNSRSYEVEFLTVAQQSLEATWQLTAGGASNATAVPTIEVEERATSPLSDVTPTETPADSPATNDKPTKSRSVSVAEGSEDSRRAALVQDSSRHEEREPAEAVPPRGVESMLVGVARRAAARAVAPTVATVLPVVSPAVQALTDALPLDVAAIEQAMRQLLADVDWLTQDSSVGGSIVRWAPTGVTVLAILCLTERLLVDRRAQHNPVLTKSRRSSWSWVLNLTESTNESTPKSKNR